MTVINIMDLMERMNNNLHTRGKSGISQLGDIQKMATTLYFDSANITNENTAELEANLIGDSKIFGEEQNMYKSVEGVYDYFSNCKQQYLENNNSMRRVA